MGLRQRVKSRIKTFFRPLSAPAGKTPPSARAAGSVAPSTAPPPAAAAVPPPARPQEPPAPPAPEAPLRPAPVAAASPPSEPSADDVAAKAARHLARTRLAVLRFIDEKGGKAGLAEMHDYSERRYFIAHKKFSDLMESLLDDDLILFDHARGEATLTAQGRAAIGKETAAAAR